MTDLLALPLPRRGEIWLAQLEHDKVRPIVVMTRTAVIRHLHAVIAAPVTSTIRSIPTELLLGEREGLRHQSVANFDGLQLVPRRALIHRIGTLDAQRLDAACRALGQATGC